MKWWLPIILVCFGCTSIKTVPTSNNMVDGSVEADSTFSAYIQPYKDSLDSYMNEVIGEVGVDMEWLRDQTETIQGNFVVDLCYDYAIHVSRLDSFGIGHPDMAILNFGGLRTSLYKGPITRGKVFELMPFENNLVAVKMTSKQIQGLIEYIGASGGQPIANAEFVISEGKTISYKINGTELGEKDYWIITSDYLANGGDKMTFFKGLPQITIGKLRDVIMLHIEGSDKPLTAKIEGRIRYGK